MALTTEAVTVVIPCHNMGHMLTGAVESALEAGAGQVVIYDDSSRDATWAIAGNLSSRYSEISYLCLSKHFRAGVCYARNFAISFADNPLIVPLDADDTLRPDSLERMVAECEPYSVVYGGWGEKKPMKKTSGYITEHFDAPPPGMLARKNLCHATYMFHKRDWLNAGGYDPVFEIGGEDWALMCALVQGGCKLKRIEGEPLYTRTIAENARTADAMGHWNTIQKLAKERYPLVFHGQPQAT